MRQLTTGSYDAVGASPSVQSQSYGYFNLANSNGQPLIAGPLSSITSTVNGQPQTLSMAPDYQGAATSYALCDSWTGGTASCTSPPTGSTQYTYGGSLGERTSQAVVGGSTGTSYAWDLTGNMCWTATINVTTPSCASPPTRSQLSGSERANIYTYDASGLRVADNYIAPSGVVGGTGTNYYTWDRVSQSVPRLIMDSYNAYIYGPSAFGSGVGPVEQITTPTGTQISQIASFMYSDPTGVRETATTSASVGTEFSFTPYGTEMTYSPGGGGVSTTFGFQGGYEDPTGLVYFVHRYYDPTTAQFLSVDPAAALTGQPYQFGNENPLNISDANGLCWLCSALSSAWHFVTHTASKAWNGLQQAACDAAAFVAGHMQDIVTAISVAATAFALVGLAVTRVGLLADAGIIGVEAAAETGAEVEVVDAAEGGVPQVLANQAAGNAARDAIAAQYPGSETEVSFDTDLGVRRVDVLTPDDVAIGSKVGYTSLTQSVQSQIAKDQWLVENGYVNGVQWEFSPSGVTAQVGPSGPLAAALEKAGFPWSIGP